ncbi:DUF1269 domain-containing protein [Flavobacterium sp. 7A]|uniref:DUF1269 domain-containing protein n=1 Tax=Flavobacterium sp. 7A TaxID=2940571 RepID=UPI0022274278|nr:DUF1269 domain-containing protein [Flavobacterium sp. 7A]MCW2118582.1 putative membrane protein/transposase [Flavobacterium sp. 7A]
MANIIVIPFTEEENAIAALHKIKELDGYGDITLYEHMMIRKKDHDLYEVLFYKEEGEGWRTLTGMALGGLLGAFAGPIGFFVGMYTGIVAGAAWDVSRHDFENELVERVSNKMVVGTIAIIAEVGEDSTIFIDDALKPFASEIIRSEAGIEFDDYIDDHIEDLEVKIERQRAKLRKATAEEKTKIKTKIADLKEKRKSKITDFEEKRKSTLKEVEEQTKTRIKKLKSRLEDYENAIEDAFAKAKINRIKRRLKKQQEKLAHLLGDLVL